MRRVHATIVAVKKKLSTRYSECVFVDLGIQHGMRMSHIVACGLSCCTTFFPKIFEKKGTEHKMGVLIFSTFVWKISHSKKKRGRYDQKCILVSM